MIYLFYLSIIYLFSIQDLFVYDFFPLYYRSPLCLGSLFSRNLAVPSVNYGTPSSPLTQSYTYPFFSPYCEQMMTARQWVVNYGKARVLLPVCGTHRKEDAKSHRFLFIVSPLCVLRPQGCCDSSFQQTIHRFICPRFIRPNRMVDPWVFPCETMNHFFHVRATFVTLLHVIKSNELEKLTNHRRENLRSRVPAKPEEGI